MCTLIFVDLFDICGPRYFKDLSILNIIMKRYLTTMLNHTNFEAIIICMNPTDIMAEIKICEKAVMYVAHFPSSPVWLQLVTVQLYVYFMTGKEPPTETCSFNPIELVLYIYLMTEIEPFSETGVLR
jgi:hypothetical protein